jgi:hypothetical protein
VFFYRRLPADTRERFIQAHTTRGKTAWSAVTTDSLTYVLLGWDRVYDLNGTPVPYDAKYLGDLAETTRASLLDASFNNPGMGADSGAIAEAEAADPL